VHEDLRRLQLDIDQDITGRVDEINQLTTYIAQLNEEVVAAGASSMDFEDKRDEAIRRLSELVPITVLPQDSGTVNVQLNGVGTLVQDHLSASIEALPDPQDRRLVKLEFTGVGGSNKRDITDRIDRGELGGLTELRDVTIGGLINDVNTLSQSFADAVNAQHRAGFDLNGNRGLDLFTFADSTGDPAANIRLNSSIKNDGDLLAISSGALRDPVSGAVTGGVPGDALNGIAITELQYLMRDAISSVQTGSTYTGAVEVGGSYDGTFAQFLAINPLDPHQVDIEFNVVNAGDPSVATFSFDNAFEPAFLATLPNGFDNAGAGYTVNDLNAILNQFNVNLNLEQNNSTFTPGDQLSVSLIQRDATFNRKVAESLQHVGQTAAKNYQQSEIFNTRLDQSETLKESVSGVSIDEELLDLTRFEKQFAANGKVIQAVNELMDSILNLVQ
jgi:flagellar hook-associated protein 1 FlgK